jgi:hypothetical protein
MVTEIAENGSLASLLPSVGKARICELRTEIRFVTVIFGMALAIHPLHSMGVIH